MSMQRIICKTCEGEGDFLIKDLWQPTYEDCKDCRGLGWVVPPAEDEDEDRD